VEKGKLGREPKKKEEEARLEEELGSVFRNHE